MKRSRLAEEQILPVLIDPEVGLVGQSSLGGCKSVRCLGDHDFSIPVFGRICRRLPALSPSSRFSCVFLLELITLCSPLFVIDFPPLSDLPNHLARIFILSTHDADPVFSQLWHSNWLLVPNLAIDIIGPTLIKLTSLVTACRIILITIITLQLLGPVLLHRAIFGRESYWPLAAGLFIYNDIFLMGFLNYLLGVGLALVGASAWVSLSHTLRKLRVPISVVLSVVLFFCHIISLAFYLIFIGAWQLTEAQREEKVSIGSLSKRLLPLVFPTIPALALYALSPSSTLHSPLVWSSLRLKSIYLMGPFLSYSIFEDIVMLSVIAIGVTLLALSYRRLVIPLGIRLSLGILIGIFLTCPRSFDGGFYLDARIPMLIVFVAVSGVAWGELATSARKLIALATTLVLVCRIILVGEIWLMARKDLADFRSMDRFIFPGARILATAVTRFEDKGSYFRDQPLNRQVRGVEDTFLHLVGFWVIDRHVFWPLLFSNPSQQPIRVVPPYDHLAVPIGEPPDYRLLSRTSFPEETLRIAPYLSDWQANFDFVVVLSFGRAQHLEQLNGLPLTLIAKTDIAGLYRILRPSSK